jgi:hypothetical protein
MFSRSSLTMLAVIAIASLLEFEWTPGAAYPRPATVM